MAVCFIGSLDNRNPVGPEVSSSINKIIVSVSEQEMKCLQDNGGRIIYPCWIDKNIPRQEFSISDKLNGKSFIFAGGEIILSELEFEKISPLVSLGIPIIIEE